MLRLFGRLFRTSREPDARQPNAREPNARKSNARRGNARKSNARRSNARSPNSTRRPNVGGRAWLPLPPSTSFRTRANLEEWARAARWRFPPDLWNRANALPLNQAEQLLRNYQRAQTERARRRNARPPNARRPNARPPTIARRSNVDGLVRLPAMPPTSFRTRANLEQWARAARWRIPPDVWNRANALPLNQAEQLLRNFQRAQTERYSRRR